METLPNFINMAKVIIIKGEVINLENIDYLNKRTGQKTQEDNTPVYLLNIIFNSGVQIAIPNQLEKDRDFFFDTLSKELGAKEISVPEMKKA